MSIYKTNSPRQTKKLANLLGQEILKSRLKKKGTLVFAFCGELGSGKTTFIQGFLRSLGIKRKITSPTFVITKNYKLKAINYKRAYHIDCYRIKKPKELLDLELKEILAGPKNILLIEWAEKIRRVLPKNAIWIKFSHRAKNNQRTIKVV
jgi:tRNA threonylcarbamoyladenosine biosynthesis protein TsaE